MKNSKLIALLATFSGNEWRAFGDFVRSPYFNKNKELIRLTNYLKKEAARDFPEDKLVREAVFAAIFPKEKYDDKQLNYATSQLLKLAERFIGLQRYEQEPVLPLHHQLVSYVERDVDKNYHYIFRQTLDRVKAQVQRNADYFFQRYLLAEVADAHFAKKKVRQYDPNLQAAADFLDVFYLAKKLRYLCMMLDQQKFIQSDYRLNLLAEVKSILATGKFAGEPTVEVYHALLLMLSGLDSAVHFESFTALLQTHFTLFPKEEQRVLYQFAINFCIHRIRFGEKEYAKNLMQLYREGVANEVLLENGQISPWTFKNMVKLGLGLQQYDWVEDFVRNYSEKLEADKRTDAYHYNMSDLFYHRQNYDEALFHLNQVEFSDIHYQLGAKVMLLKIYYEIDATEAFLSLVSSFKIFLLRNKSVPKSVKAPYESFVNLAYELFKSDDKGREKLHTKIRETQMLNDRTWLLQQLENGKNGE